MQHFSQFHSQFSGYCLYLGWRWSAYDNQAGSWRGSFLFEAGNHLFIVRTLVQDFPGERMG
jgi:hypothetical protein